MTELIAHLRLLGRRGRKVWVGGCYWSYCTHRSHRHGRRCLRWATYDGYCAEHNQSCWGACPQDL